MKISREMQLSISRIEDVLKDLESEDKWGSEELKGLIFDTLGMDYARCKRCDLWQGQDNFHIGHGLCFECLAEEEDAERDDKELKDRLFRDRNV